MSGLPLGSQRHSTPPSLTASVTSYIVFPVPVVPTERCSLQPGEGERHRKPRCFIEWDDGEGEGVVNVFDRRSRL